MSRSTPDGFKTFGIGKYFAGIIRWRGFDSAVILACIFIATLIVLGIVHVPDSVYASQIGDRFLPPSAQHWFGTDQLGRDVFWRVVVGAQYSVLLSIVIVIGYSILGIALALLATIGGRIVDEAVMRFTDACLSLPMIIFGLALAAVLGPSIESAVIALIFTGWPFTARLARSIMRDIMATEYVLGAKCLGVSQTALLWRHVLPNSMDVLLVKAAGDVGNVILVLSSLSFIGVGAQPPLPEWGAMVTDSRSYMTTAWWATIAPGLAIAITATVFGMLGEMLQVRFNPVLRGTAAAARLEKKSSAK